MNEVQWWRNRVKLHEKRHYPKTFWGKLFISKDKSIQKQLKESIFQLGFTIGRHYELSNHKFPEQMKFKNDR